MSDNTIFTGVGVAIVTPFNKNGSVNYDKLGGLIEAQIAGGTDALIICGTTGESSTLTDEEHLECIRYAVKKTNGRIPVIAGTGSNDTAYAVEMSKDAEKAGADALLLVTPYYNKTSQKGLIAHFTAIADSVNIPIVLYNVPSRTGCKIEISTYKELAKHKNIKAAKEACGDISSRRKRRYIGSFQHYSLGNARDGGLCFKRRFQKGGGIAAKISRTVKRAVL